MPPTSKNPPAAWADQVEIFPAWAPCPNGLVPNIGNGGQMCSNFNGDTDDMGIYIYTGIWGFHIWRHHQLIPHGCCRTNENPYCHINSVPRTILDILDIPLLLFEDWTGPAYLLRIMLSTLMFQKCCFAFPSSTLSRHELYYCIHIYVYIYTVI